LESRQHFFAQQTDSVEGIDAVRRSELYPGRAGRAQLFSLADNVLRCTREGEAIEGRV
jgi:hypothetical protein